jgi:hypothetical protein
MELTKEQRFEALVEITAALIRRAPSLPAHSQLVNDADARVKAITERL